MSVRVRPPVPSLSRISFDFRGNGSDLPLNVSHKGAVPSAPRFVPITPVAEPAEPPPAFRAHALQVANRREARPRVSPVRGVLCGSVRARSSLWAGPARAAASEGFIRTSSETLSRGQVETLDKELRRRRRTRRPGAQHGRDPGAGGRRAPSADRAHRGVPRAGGRRAQRGDLREPGGAPTQPPGQIASLPSTPIPKPSKPP